MSEDIVWVDGYIPGEEIETYISFDLIYDTVMRVQALIDNGEWKDVYLDREHYYDDSSSPLKFCGKRRETDRERTERLNQIQKNLLAAKKAEKTKELNERKEYERLKKKFGG